VLARPSGEQQRSVDIEKKKLFLIHREILTTAAMQGEHPHGFPAFARVGLSGPSGPLP
jgi:hypothetical protein